MRGSGVYRQDEHDHFCRINRMNDRTGIKLAGDDIARCDPTLGAVALKDVDDGFGDGRVLRGVADEDAEG